MELLSEKGIALQFVDNKVFIKIYPQTDMLVEIKREAALHLYNLVNKYNHTINNSKKWGAFWRKITQIERTMTVFFIKTNSYAGSPIYLKNREALPKDFSMIDETTKLQPKAPGVLEELEQLLQVYIEATIKKEDVQNYWEKYHPETCAIIKKHNQFENLVSSCFDKTKIEKIMEAVLTKEGLSAFEKPEWAESYTEDIFKFLVHNEIALFSSTAFQLVSWKMND